MEQEQQKSWQKPELIVLVRSKPEEAVLIACKSSAEKNRNACSRGACPSSLQAAS